VQVLHLKELYLGLIHSFSCEFSPCDASQTCRAGGQDRVVSLPTCLGREHRFSGSNGAAASGARFAASS